MQVIQSYSGILLIMKQFYKKETNCFFTKLIISFHRENLDL